MACTIGRQRGMASQSRGDLGQESIGRPRCVDVRRDRPLRAWLRESELAREKLPVTGDTGIARLLGLAQGLPDYRQ
jgi:hypothetical protein